MVDPPTVPGIFSSGGGGGFAAAALFSLSSLVGLPVSMTRARSEEEEEEEFVRLSRVAKGGD